VAWNTKKVGKKEIVSLKKDPENETKAYKFFHDLETALEIGPEETEKYEKLKCSAYCCMPFESLQEVVIAKCCDQIEANLKNENKVTAFHRSCASRIAAQSGQMNLRCTICGHGST